MTDSAPLVQVLLHSISKPTQSPDGGVEMLFDPEFLRYRLMSVGANNFPAFVKEYKDMISVAQEMARTMHPEIGGALARYFVERADNMLISITAESSHHAELTRLLLQDRKEVAYLEAAPQKPGIMDRIAGATQPQEQQGPPPQ